MPGMVGSHENWGNFKCHKWGELLRHSQGLVIGLVEVLQDAIYTQAAAVPARAPSSRAGGCCRHRLSEEGCRGASRGAEQEVAAGRLLRSSQP
jgi:hypothetical protein